jgi:DNA-binding transcriptional regulator/RsmH inhibitor MraZ
LRKHAGLDTESELLIVGMDNRLEIWARSRWEAMDAALSEGDLEEMGAALQL